MSPWAEELLTTPTAQQDGLLCSPLHLLPLYNAQQMHFCFLTQRSAAAGWCGKSHKP